MLRKYWVGWDEIELLKTLNTTLRDDGEADDQRSCDDRKADYGGADDTTRCDDREADDGGADDTTR